MEIIAQDFPSTFFTIDLALGKSGEWMVVEVGDVQVSGIPDENFKGFYQALSAAVN